MKTERKPRAVTSPLNWRIKSLGLVLVLVIAGCFVFFSQGRLPQMMGVVWKDIDFLAREIPQDIKTAVVQNPAEVRERNVDIQGLKVSYLEALPGTSAAEPSGQTVILLHGQAFKASTWHRELPTLQTISAMGHRAVAIDLPGFGNTPAQKVDEIKFMEGVISALSPDVKPILVSPSMSGTYSLPLVMNRPDLVCGYIPVAPVMTNLFTADQYKAMSTPTLIVYGERDTSLGRTSAQHLSQIPTSSQPQIIPKARHPCYLDDPDRWHTLIYNFVKEFESIC